MVELLIDGRIVTKEWAEENGFGYRELTPAEMVEYIKHFIK